MTNKKGLGKGLYDLMKEDEGAPSVFSSFFNSGKNNNVSIVPISNIEANPNQPRTSYSTQELEELALSIKENGVLQPIIVRRKPGAANLFQIVAGERRYRAADLAGLDTIPAIIKDLSDKEVMVIALIENLQREDMNAIDTANGLNSLIDTYSYSHEQIAQMLGKSRSYITNLLRLLKLPDDIKEKLKNKEISPSLARTIVSMPDLEKVKELLQKQNLTVKDVSAIKENQANMSKPLSDKDKELLKMEGDLTSYYKMPVKINHKKMGNYEIVIKINSVEKLKEIIYHHLIKGV